MNDNRIVREQRVGSLSCLIIDDYFKNPEDTLENFLKIPFDSGQKVLETESLKDDDEQFQFLKQMGDNQIIHLQQQCCSSCPNAQKPQLRS